MLKRRTFLALSAAVALAACAEPLVDAQVAGQLNVVSVSVDVSGIQGVKGRMIEIAPERVERDIRATLASQLRQGSVGSRDVKADLVVQRFRLVSPGESLMVGGTSIISGLMTVTDAKTGEVIVPPTTVVGTAKNGWQPGGLLGAMTKASITPEDDYKQTVAGFAADVRKRLFGAKK
tara:strand:+ start:91 stop:621 length:531 start_codon:yes stop_codon:yes gene_type:complete